MVLGILKLVQLVNHHTDMEKALKLGIQQNQVRLVLQGHSMRKIFNMENILVIINSDTEVDTLVIMVEQAQEK